MKTKYHCYECHRNWNEEQVLTEDGRFKCPVCGSMFLGKQLTDPKFDGILFILISIIVVETIIIIFLL
jgi:DNA-directed RNA polymerase subunit RPC12/RpoP